MTSSDGGRYHPHMKVGLMLVLAASVLACTAPQVRVDDKKPNIVFILADNLGYGELGCYGGGILGTPGSPGR
jgi:arylsulfatase